MIQEFTGHHSLVRKYKHASEGQNNMQVLLFSLVFDVMKINLIVLTKKSPIVNVNVKLLLIPKKGYSLR